MFLISSAGPRLRVNAYTWHFVASSLASKLHLFTQYCFSRCSYAQSAAFKCSAVNVLLRSCPGDCFKGIPSGGKTSSSLPRLQRCLRIGSTWARSTEGPRYAQSPASSFGALKAQLPAQDVSLSGPTPWKSCAGGHHFLSASAGIRMPVAPVPPSPRGASLTAGSPHPRRVWTQSAHLLPGPGPCEPRRSRACSARFLSRSRGLGGRQDSDGPRLGPSRPRIAARSPGSVQRQKECHYDDNCNDDVLSKCVYYDSNGCIDCRCIGAHYVLALRI
jgi:hypothetical protein